MSFSTDVKNELARVNDASPCCATAETAALMRMGGAMVIGGGQAVGITFSTENAAVARKFLTLVKRGFGLTTEVMVSRGRRLKKTNVYMVKVLPSPAVGKLLSTLGFVGGSGFNSGRDGAILRKSCCRRAYLRGAFLGGGSVNRPEGDYHLELVTANTDFARTVERAMKSFGLPARVVDRKQSSVIYLKDGDDITSFLRIIGAHDALMAFENVRVLKDMRNQVNRLVNCETANLQKTVNAAVRQTEKIAFIAARIGLEELPRGLREAAEARLAHPEATLQELVDAVEGRVGKSGMNHRLRKLEQIADELSGGGADAPR